MRRPMPDWDEMQDQGSTEPLLDAVPISEDDIDTLRMLVAASACDEEMIEYVLGHVEAERPSGPDIDTCVDSRLRSEFPAAASVVSEGGQRK